ncbi:Myotubularin-related protein 9 [Fragariocoptes setiger]|uniref:Myotubularin-related protein 9 n=1 Tax=Fragariocoptes setiger TaxID=1670756 RepID=A0ABQ7S9C6_9ACAR|nr:Myotubularin-related protein 9 [Fragariocoptes setiger]
MEFAELIQIPKLDNVTLHRNLHTPIQVTLCITCHHLILSSRSNNDDEIWILHVLVDNVERRITSTQNSLILKCKDFRQLQLDVRGHDELNSIANSIEWLSNLDDPRLLYPFFYRAMFDIVEDGWVMFQLDREYNKIFMQSGDELRISHVNKDYAVCATYPELVVVPKSIPDDHLIKSAKFRCLGRFPVLSYLHKPNKAVIFRSGQPMIGPDNKRCREDERILTAMIGAKRGYIIETRTLNMAQLAKTKGGGYEPEAHYPLLRRVHRPIDRHHVLLDSLTKLIEACNDKTHTTERWLSRLEASAWLKHVQDVLNCACLVAQCIDQESASVLVHGSEGTDTTLLVCSLAQVILDPDCRTVHGFEALVEREWLQGGHPFATRCKHSVYTPANQRTREQSPVFLLFLDCVHQIYAQFKCSFEFNPKFLILLFENAYGSQYGTFLSNSAKLRRELSFQTRTVSLWSYMNRPEVLEMYLNPVYEPNNQPVWPSVAPQSLNLWIDVYLRWSMNAIERDKANQRLHHIKTMQREARQEVNRLRRRLEELTELQNQFQRSPRTATKTFTFSPQHKTTNREASTGLEMAVSRKTTKYRFVESVTEDHHSPIFGIQFNRYIRKKQLFATVGSNRVTIYEIQGDRIVPMQTYCDPDRSESFYCCDWSVQTPTDSSSTDSTENNRMLTSVLLAAGAKGIIRVILPETSQCVKYLIGHGCAINDLKVSPTMSDIILSSSKDYSLRLWNFKTSTCVAIFGGVEGHRDEVLSSDFHYTGEKIISCGMDHSLKIWTLDEEVQQAIAKSHVFQESTSKVSFPTVRKHFPTFTTRDIHTNYVDCARWLGNFILSKSCEDEIVCWKPGKLESPTDIDIPSKYTTDSTCTILERMPIKDCEIWFIRFSIDPYMRVLALGNKHGKTYVYDIQAQDNTRFKSQVLSHPKCTATVRQTCFSDDASILLCACDDGTIWRWQTVTD